MGKVGRPTKFKEEYCDMVIDHMEDGYSFESFAGLVGVSKSTLYEWRDNYPEFSDSVKIAFEKCRLWWENQGRQGLWSIPGERTFNASNYIFQMKNRFKEEWRDRQELDHTTAGEKMNIINLGAGVKPEDEE